MDNRAIITQDEAMNHEKSNEMKGIHVIIKGHVQGVGFRAHTYYRARELGLKGFVRNLPDRHVEIYLYGHKEQLDKLIHALKSDRVGRIDEIETTYSANPQHCDDFSIR